MWTAWEAIIQSSEKRILPGANKWFHGATVDDAGAAMVELALVFILLVMLLVGTVSAAIAFGQGNSIQNAAREASRFAATYERPDKNPDAVDWDDWLGDVRDVAKAASSGDLDPSAPGYYVCVAYVDGAANVRATEGTPPPLPVDNTCYADGRPLNETRVQVTAGREVTINAILFSPDVTLDAQAAARYER